ncbi:MAG: metallophosphoesterase [Bacteroidales bacterium]|nr:metallophosphoesterase [Bacteroidales bacterium]
MKNQQMIIFFTIVLLIYSLVNIYIYTKGFNAISFFRSHRLLYLVTFAGLAGTFIAGKILESRHSSVFSDILNIAGGFWMAFMLYGFIFLLASDLLYLILRISGILGHENVQLYRKLSYLVTLSVSIILITAGFVNALTPHVIRYDVAIGKKADGISSMRVVAVSDVHLGSIIRKRSVKKLSMILEKLQPDLVLLLGDIVDGEIGPVLRGDLLKYFACPHCKNGMYAITGNHEFIGGAERTIPYIESKGIKILKDEVATIEGGIQLIGRLDRDSRRFYAKERASLEELIKDADKTKPLILLDHQPFNLEEAENNGIDLQLSGHTHNGQIWPLNWLTGKMYELSHGYLKKGNTHYIVSSGYGIWGPRIRLGSRPEVLLINLVFNGALPSPGR